MGNINDFFKDNFLKPYHLWGPVEVKLKAIEKEIAFNPGTRKEAEVPVMYFDSPNGKGLPFDPLLGAVMCKTMYLAMVHITGEKDWEKWAATGATFLVYPVTETSYGRTREVVRVKPRGE